MQTLTTCMQCQVETGFPNFSSLALADIPESGVIEVLCDRGHRTATVIQDTKFEILSEMGIKALVSNSYRDAVSSLAAALERLFEFFVEATCHKRGISAEEFGATWKSMANQSERQLGAFLGTYLLETGEAAKLLPRKQVEFRNAVVHKGRLPNGEETTEFGRAMLACALPVLNVLRSAAYRDTILSLTLERVRVRSAQARAAGLIPSTMSNATPLNLFQESDIPEFDTIVANYAARPDFARHIEDSCADRHLADAFVKSKLSGQ